MPSMTPEVQVGGSGQVWKVVFQLVQFALLFGIVLVLAYVSSRFLGRRLASGGSGRHIRLLDQLPLGPNRGLFLVAVAGKVLVVGLAEGGVNLICEIQDPETVRSLVENAGSAAGAAGPGTLTGSLWSRAGELGLGDFARKLQKALGKARETNPDKAEDTAEFSGQIRHQIRRLRDLSRGRGDGNADD